MNGTDLNDDTEPQLPHGNADPAMYIELARLGGGDRAAEYLEKYLEGLNKIAQNHLNHDPVVEPDPIIQDLSERSPLSRAAALFIAIYNGSFIRLDSNWLMVELMPDQYLQLPLKWVFDPARHLSAEHQARIREQARWETHTLLAASVADVPNDNPDFVKQVADRFRDITTCWPCLSLRLVGIGGYHDRTALRTYVCECVAEVAAILQRNWRAIERLFSLCIPPTSPEVTDVIRLVGLQGRRFQRNSPNALLFDFFRSKLAPHSGWSKKPHPKTW